MVDWNKEDQLGCCFYHSKQDKIVVSSRVAAEGEKGEFKMTPVELADELERREGLGDLV